jgi:hypothetical protein
LEGTLNFWGQLEKKTSRRKGKYFIEDWGTRGAKGENRTFLGPISMTRAEFFFRGFQVRVEKLVV